MEPTTAESFPKILGSSSLLHHPSVLHVDMKADRHIFLTAFYWPFQGRHWTDRKAFHPSVVQSHLLSVQHTV